MFSFIENLSIEIIEEENVTMKDFNDPGMVTWDEHTYRQFFKACDVKQKVEVFDAIKSMKALAIKFTDEEGDHRVFMPQDTSGEQPV